MAFLSTLGQEGWEKILLEFDRKEKQKVDVEELKEELWDIVMEFGEPIRIGTGLNRKQVRSFPAKFVISGKRCRGQNLDSKKIALL